MHVVASRFYEPGDITGTWIFTELYTDDSILLDNLYIFGNCMKIQISEDNSTCQCFQRKLPAFQIITTIKGKVTQDVVIYFCKNYKEFEGMGFMIHDKVSCNCKKQILWARVISNNYLVIYNKAAAPRPNIILIARNLTTVPKDIEELEANNEEIYNRSHAVMCSIINRQIYFN